MHFYFYLKCDLLVKLVHSIFICLHRAGMPDNLTQQSTSHPTKSTFSSAKDPFIELESTSVPSYNSSEAFSDPLEEIGKFNSSGGTKFDSPSNSTPPFRIPPIPKPGHKADKGASASLNSLVLMCPIWS